MAVTVQVDIEVLADLHDHLVWIIDNLDRFPTDAGDELRATAERIRVKSNAMLDQIEDVLDAVEAEDSLAEAWG
ncbi:MAG: hypothetical protein QOF51_717 [Chloroflexota bacterium]|nr:hypothetical protein [Chloroflexota bacterium]